MTYYDQVVEAAEFLRGRLGGLAPRVGIVLGSGLGAVADAVAGPVLCLTGRFRTFRNRRSRDTRDGLWPGCWAACRWL